MLRQQSHHKIPSAYLLLLIAALLVNFCAINTGFFTDDPGLYGAIAKQLVYKHEFWQLFTYGHDWLDKPHLPFWLVLVSYKIFGISSWSYRLPALLCFLLSLLYTWLFTKKYYDQLTAIIAVLIVSTSLHIIMSNTDVRAEPYLMAFIIGAIYHVSNLQDRFSVSQLLLAALLTAFAIMTKGIFVIAPIYGALGGQLLLQGKLREAFKLKWLALVLLTLIFTAPEFYALYIQFDLHPEKVVFGRQHVSGLKFFLWDSQFGRFTNSGPITRKQSDIFFFVHTLLWAFAPWCLLFYFALGKSVKKVIGGIKQPEYYTLCGGLLLLILFSVSGFQLPFYTNIIFPLFAIITANFCVQHLPNKAENSFRTVAQWLYIAAFTIAIFLLHFILHPGVPTYLVIGMGILLLGIVCFIRSKQEPHLKVFLLSCTVMVFVGFYVNTTLYPVIIENKGEIKAADYVNHFVPDSITVYSLKDQNNNFQFYCNRPVKLILFKKLSTTPSDPGAVFYADQETVDYLHNQHIAFKIIWQGWDYPQENILPAFINHNTRTSTLQKVYLITRT